MRVLSVAADLLREAAARRWFLVLWLGITLVLAVVAFALELDVVDGALAATTFFGRTVGNPTIQAADVALRPLFGAAAYLVFYGGLVFGILACADFGPSLLSPGRIEHLLALPVRRAELLVGTFLGVLVLAVIFSIYGAGGLSLILGLKTGAWALRPLISALLAAVAFAGLYGAMLSTAVFVRSAALSAVVGFGLLIAGIIAGYRADLASVFQAGAPRQSFELLTLVLPRISTLADAAGSLAAHEPVDLGRLLRLLVGLALFGAGALAVGIWRFERRDF